MKMLLLIISSAILATCLADDPATVAAAPMADNEKPVGTYYCQARCLASCLETFLAPTIQECEKFCPPFDDNPPCPDGDTACWQTCGVPPSDNDQPPPPPVSFMPSQDPNEQSEQSPFLIDLVWTGVPGASLYIVEFYPVDRKPKPGENNFFRTMTTSLMYTVRKEDECIAYDARVIAVNSYGISDPTSTHISAPVPRFSNGPASEVSPSHFNLRNMQRDPLSEGMVAVTIDYTFPYGWPADDIDLDLIRVTANDCKGQGLGERTFGKDINADPDAIYLNPAYNALIGKTPTTAIQLSFFDDVIQSDCMFQVMVLSVVTRCNTSTTYDAIPGIAPGINFRINCDSFPDACNNNSTFQITQEALVPAPIPVPAGADEIVQITSSPDAIVLPAHLPPGVAEPEASISSVETPLTDSNITIQEMPPPPPIDDDTLAPMFNVTESNDLAEIPTPPPLPMAMVDASQAETPDQQPMAPGISFSVVDVSPNGSDAQTVEVVPQMVVPPMCELDMIDVQPSVNAISPSLIDLTITWLEHQTLPALPPASYFTIRYGPLVRQLVADEREPKEIIPGYETFVRTGQPGIQFDPTRHINASGIQRNSLLKLQICAFYDPNSEPMISWDLVPSRTVDLAALEPFLDADDQIQASTSDTPVPLNLLPLPADYQPDPMMPTGPDFGFGPPIGVEPPAPDSSDDTVVPVIIAVGVEDRSSNTMYYLTVLAGILLVVFTAWTVFACLRRASGGRRKACKMGKQEKAIVFVNPPMQMPAPSSPDVKIPIA